ncbi:Uncharacterised protein [Mycobacterium tuberculosis]|nr:Uncharacterised protein [Mycobacterium tuberculosis]
MVSGAGRIVTVRSVSALAALHHRLGIEPVGNRPGRGGDPRITHPVQCGHVGAQLGVECAAILDVQAGRLPHDQRGPPLR